MRVIAFAVLSLIALVATASGAEETPEQAAKKVLTATAAGDDAALATLAARDEPDPWLVAEELVARGERDAALAFARAAARPATEKLPAAIEAGCLDVDAALRKKLAEVLGHLEGKRPAEALALLESVEAAPEGFAAVRISSLRAAAQNTLRRFRESAATYERAAEAAEALGWLADAGRFFHLGGLGRYRLGSYPDAIRDFGECERLFRLVGDEPRVAGTLGRLSLCHRLRGEFDEALRLQRESFTMHEDAGRRRDAAVILGYMGSTHSARGEHEKAEEHHLRALRIFEELGCRRERALTLGNLANAAQRLGRLDESRELRERSLRDLREVGTPREIARELGNLGSLKFSLGDYLGALETFEDSLARAEALKDRNQVALTRFNLGNCRNMLGDRAGSALDYEAAVGLCRAMGSRGWLVTMLRTWGEVLVASGDPERGIVAIEEAAATSHEVGNRREEVRARSALARIYMGWGNYPAAWEQEVLADALRKELGRNVALINSMNNRAALFASVGDYGRAISLTDQAIELARETGTPLELARTLEQAGHLREWSGDIAGALPAVREARRIYEKLNRTAPLSLVLADEGRLLKMQGKLEEALALMRLAVDQLPADADLQIRQYVLGDLGALLCSLGRIAESEKYVRESLAAARESNSAEGEIVGRWNLSVLERKAGRPGAALVQARAAVRKLKRHYRGLPEREYVHVWERWHGLFEAGVKAALDAGDVEAALFFIESGRAEGLVEMLGGRGVLEPRLVSPELRSAESKARGAESVAFHRLKRAEKAGVLAEVRAAKKVLEAARDEVEEIVTRIQRETKSGGGAMDPVPVTSEQLRAGLRPGEVLVLYLVGDHDFLAVVVSEEGARLVLLGASRAIRELCRIVSSVAPDADPAPAAKLLAGRILDPLGLPESATRLVVGPDRELALVPVSLLAPDLEIAFVSSGTVFAALRRQQLPPGNGVLALGAPELRSEPESGLLAYGRGEELGPLPASRKEAKTVGDKVLLGAACSEASLAKALAERKRWRAVHFACHGVLNEHNPLLSALVLTPDEENDGHLTCLDLILRPVPTDLAVLSACGTGRGRVFGGEGIQGLARAFALAGSTRVLCSLWDVDDEATRALMVKFYELWNPTGGGGLPAVAALKKAQRFVRGHEKWSHPYFWAAWVLWGLPD